MQQYAISWYHCRGCQMLEAPNIDIVQYLLHVLNCHIRIS